MTANRRTDNTKRNIGQEILDGIRDIKAGRGNRKVVRELNTLEQALSGVDRLGDMCGRAYQIIATLAEHAGVFDHPDVEKALDNYSQYDDPPHGDLSPWPKTPLGKKSGARSG